ncbi:hypothetical protein [Streptomyces chattanoogensis]|uniref:Uncharacterized protein n=1 Tax=Streptomyces chattanoogensis TaxID=66876 RepID=A0A0N0GZC0_9ACTN|nr:hypothetical protein [Streptomyces chattanoogensis]KPC62621.1 hypothetical protein ADL29_17830 [Streptomyces chattanoogensis]
MFRRRARDREFREAQLAGHALLQMHANQPAPDFARPATASAPAAPITEEVPDFLPPDLRVPSRDEVEGMMMRWEQPLVLDGEVRECPQCGAYRDWIVFSMRDDTIWLRCRAGHNTAEPRLDAAWYNRNSGPVDAFHPTLEEGLRHCGH